MKEIININVVIYVMMFGSHKQTLNTKHVIAVVGGWRRQEENEIKFRLKLRSEFVLELFFQPFDVTQ